MAMKAKDKDLRRRQRRVTKLRALKTRLAGTTDSRVRERLAKKIAGLQPFSPRSK
jgi:hypothetical protein